MLILTVRRASFAWTAKRQKKEQQIKGKKRRKKSLENDFVIAWICKNKNGFVKCQKWYDGFLFT